jgi:hypothetical protein
MCGSRKSTSARLVRMTLDPVLEEKRGEILRIAAEHGAREVRVFGSGPAGRPMGKAI